MHVGYSSPPKRRAFVGAWAIAKRKKSDSKLDSRSMPPLSDCRPGARPGRSLLAGHFFMLFIDVDPALSCDLNFRVEIMQDHRISVRWMETF